MAVPPSAVDDTETTIVGFAAYTYVTVNDVLPAGSTGYPVITAPLVATVLPSGASVICVEDGACTYTPAANSTPGTDTYQYTVADSTNRTETATAVVTVTQTANTPPTADDDNYTVGVDRVLLLVGDNDSDQETTYYDRRARLETPPQHGTVVRSPPVYDASRIGCRQTR
jgi:Bacterial Ig domain